MKIGIVITCKNLLQYTRQAIESINTAFPFLLVVVDDESTDDTKEYLAALKAAYPTETHLITDPLVHSLAAKWNMAARVCWEAGCGVVLICNNDIIFSPATIDALGTRMRKGDVGMVTAHNIRGELQDPMAILHTVAPENPTEAPGPDFSCFMISKDTWDRVGPFDEQFIPMYFEDGDYHLRMGKAGVLAIATTSAPYYHYGSVTQQSVKSGVCSGPQFDRLRKYLRHKHGTVPGEAEYTRITNKPWEDAHAN